MYVNYLFQFDSEMSIAHLISSALPAHMGKHRLTEPGSGRSSGLADTILV
jgi:hypothetical protein